MPRRLLALASAGVAAALAACQSDPLEVRNPNAPIVNELLSTSTGAQTLDSRLFQFAFSGQYGSSDAIWPQTQVLAGESEGTVANFGLLARGGFSRAAIDNTPNNPIQAGNVRDFSFLTRTARQASLVVNALNQFASSYDPGVAPRNRAFAYFTLGYSLGHLALIYDSVAVITPATSADSLPGFTAAPAAMTVALAMLDTAQQLASTSGTAAIPAAWMSTAADVPSSRFVQLIRSYKARFRANVPRTPDGVAGVDWGQVAADAQAGLTSDFVIQLNQGTNWVAAFLNQALVSASYHQMPYWVIGMADTTGSYASWVAAANASKSPFLIRTPDRRFPSGETRAAQNTFVSSTTVPPSDSVLYFRNRLSGSDAAGGPTGGSYYDYYRFLGYRTNNLQGPWPLFTRAESDMLAAEGLIRTGNLTAALPLIDRYRVRAGLPRLVGTVTSLNDVVPGGNACVPRFPVRSGTTVTLQCANAFEAMKYEKRLETAFTGYAAWFLDARRWSDLIVGTPLEWPVPWQETAARGITATYQNQRVATSPNTYGWLGQ